jgi:hypothetical protein
MPESMLQLESGGVMYYIVVEHITRICSMGPNACIIWFSDGGDLRVNKRADEVLSVVERLLNGNSVADDVDDKRS